MPISDDLVSVLRLTESEPGVYLSESGNPLVAIYGGQLMAQAIMAAGEGVDGRSCHSVQASFVRRAVPSLPLTYLVEEMMTGQSFAMRRVIVSQDGREILSTNLSFRESNLGVTHRLVSPSVPVDPAKIDDNSLNDGNKRIWRKLPPAGLDISWVHPSPVLGHDAVWMKSSYALCDCPILQCAALVYASDYPLLEATLPIHQLSWQTPGLTTASLTQSAWIIRPSDFNRWHLFCIDAPVAAGGTALGRANCFNEHGELVAMFVQEALIRPRVLVKNNAET